jgi:hypothetical protein
MATCNGGGSGSRRHVACWLGEPELGDDHVRRTTGEPPEGGVCESCARDGARTVWGTTSSAKVVNAGDL